MELLTWIDKKITEINGTLLFSKYFDTILPEEGIDVSYLFNPSAGIDIIIRKDNSIKAIHFYSGKIDGASQFKDALPFNIDFSQTREAVQVIFGKPGQSGGGEKSFLYNKTKFSDKYFFDRYDLHLQFSEIDSTIDLMTISSNNDSGGIG